MRDNIDEVVSLQPDLLGFIFYHKSPRYVGDLSQEEINRIPETIEKVGVFVNNTEEEVIEAVRQFDLQYVQLHGDESVAYCETIRSHGIKIIKVFGGNKELSNEILDPYAAVIEHIANQIGERLLLLPPQYYLR
ncbi:MAG: hypothetical protein AAFN93_02310, partial [Bacteroidota bacterium]